MAAILARRRRRAEDRLVHAEKDAGEQARRWKGVQLRYDLDQDGFITKAGLSALYDVFLSNTAMQPRGGYPGAAQVPVRLPWP